jgi:hypothetical protein
LLYWSQIEPESGRYVWDAVDTFLEQLEPSDEDWIMLGSSSQWATRRTTDVLPSSPARDLEGYARFVSTLVRHCKGKVRYWQMDNEPHHPSFWHGSAADYVDQLKVFYRAVKEAAPEAFVILAGAAGISSPTLADLPMKQAEREFFEHLMREGADYYDVFDLHLYADPYIIPTEIEGLREMMAALGYQKPIFAGEYNGPLFFLFKENLPYVSLMGQVMSAIRTEDAQE